MAKTAANVDRGEGAVMADKTTYNYMLRVIDPDCGVALASPVINGKTCFWITIVISINRLKAIDASYRGGHFFSSI